MTNLFPDFNDASYYEPVPLQPDYHSVFSIQLCELINDGWIDFDDESWDFDSYKREGIENDREQRDRFWKKFKRRFYWREIGIIPPGQWKWEVLRKLDEIMPKYKPAYRAIDEGVDIFRHYGEYGKSRNIFSEFPQTQLGGNEDYASNGTDREHEEIYLGDWMEQTQKLQKQYDDIDVLILEELETMFSCMFTVNVNGY